MTANKDQRPVRPSVRAKIQTLDGLGLFTGKDRQN